MSRLVRLPAILYCVSMLVSVCCVSVSFFSASVVSSSLRRDRNRSIQFFSAVYLGLETVYWVYVFVYFLFLLEGANLTHFSGEEERLQLCDLGTEQMPQIFLKADAIQLLGSAGYQELEIFLQCPMISSPFFPSFWIGRILYWCLTLVPEKERRNNCRGDTNSLPTRFPFIIPRGPLSRWAAKQEKTANLGEL